MRITALAAAVSLALVGLSSADEAIAAVRKATLIPQQSLGSALRALAKDRNFQVLVRSDLIRDRYTSGASGDLTLNEALTQLLSGTALTFQYLDERTVTVIPKDEGGTATGGAEKTDVPGEVSGGSDAKESSDAGAGGAHSQGGLKSFWDRFRLAQADERASSGVSSAASQSTGAAAVSKPSALEEIVVTAQKREEHLQDVPVPVTVLNATILSDDNQARLQDYYAKVPGLNLSFGTRGEPLLAIRGLATGGATNPTVGYTVDDVPYGFSTGLGGGFLAPEFDPSELDRIEVLRGPQGTLYGASSLGGLVKYVTKDPSIEGVSGRVQTGLSSIHNGDGVGYNVSAAVNLPLGDTTAVRVSGFTRSDPGYIDNPVQSLEGVNSRDGAGGRVSFLWRPSERVSLKLDALNQKNTSDGWSKVYNQPGLGDLQQNTTRGLGALSVRKQAYDAIFKLDIGRGELTSTTAYSENELHDTLDYSVFYSGTVSAYLGVPAAAAFIEDFEGSKFSEELRFETQLGDRVDWLVGGFFTDEDVELTQQMFGLNATTLATLSPQLLFSSVPTTFREYAVFTDLTFHLTSRFDLQVGGRQSRNEQTLSQFNIGPYQTLIAAAPNPLVVQEIDSEDDAFTYLLTPRFKVSPHLMMYARLASGYRAGGPNANTTAVPGVLPDVKADTTNNYEVGIKGNVFDRLLSFDLSLYRIDWKDLQITVASGGVSFIVNAGAARSQGAELSVDFNPGSGTHVAAWTAFNDAELTERFPTGAVAGFDGSRLPYSARITGGLTLEQEFPVTAGVTGYVGGTASHVGKRTGRFRGFSAPGVGLPRQTFDAYTQVDLRAGARFNSWSTSFYVNNSTDKRGVLSGGLGDTFPFTFTHIQPRTIGLSAAKTF